MCCRVDLYRVPKFLEREPTGILVIRYTQSVEKEERVLSQRTGTIDLVIPLLYHLSLHDGSVYTSTPIDGERTLLRNVCTYLLATWLQNPEYVN